MCERFWGGGLFWTPPICEQSQKGPFWIGLSTCYHLNSLFLKCSEGRFLVKCYLNPTNISTFLNVVVRLILDRDVEARLCTSTLEFTTLNNVESTLSIPTLVWTTLDNVKATLTISSLGNMETMLWMWPFVKN